MPAMPPASRLLILGWDAADWKVADPLLRLGTMPNLARLIGRGVRADLSTLQPALSPLLWTSIATGKTADKHGVLNFIEPDPQTGALRIACSTSRRTKALWNILGQAGRTTHVVSWYASHPAEPIRGVCISNMFQESPPDKPGSAWPMAPGSVHPAGETDRIAALRVRPQEITDDLVRRFVPRLRDIRPGDKRIGLLRRLLAQCESVHRVAMDLVSRPEGWDAAMVFHDTIDVVGHHFMAYHPPRMQSVPQRDFDLYSGVMRATYEHQDRLLGALLERAGPETTVVLLSDHGFHSDHLRPSVPPAVDDTLAAMDASWHRPLGMLVMAGPGVRQCEQVGGAGLLDIAPTVLSLLGLPVGADMDGRVLIEALDPRPAVERIESWDTAEGEAGQHPPDLRVDPFEAGEAMRQLIDLGYIQDPGEDQMAALARASRETRFNLGVVLMTAGRVGRALPVFEGLAREAPDEPRYVLNLAQCLHSLGRHAESRAVLDPFLRDHPEHTEAPLHLAAALFAEQRLDEAAGALEGLERRDPGRPEVGNLLGMVRVFQRRYEDAERLFGAAVSLDPHNPRAHHGLALAAAGRGELERAAEHCLEALDLLHRYPDAHYTLGAVLAWMGEREHAVQSFRIALSMQPGLIDAHRYLALLLGPRGESEAAAHHAAEAERLSRERPMAAPPPGCGPPLTPAEWANRPRGK